MPTHSRHLETKSMSNARLRNQMEQKTLGQRLDVLSSHFRCRSSKLMTEIGQLEEHMKLMTPVGGKAIICPTGLTEAEKTQYRRLRRGSCTPSMSLEEFDIRITDFRHEMMTYRRGSHPTNYEDVFLEDAGIVDLEDHEFCAPLTKHKHTMKEAFKRASTTATEITTYSTAPPKTRAKSASSSRAGDSISTASEITTYSTAPPKTRAKSASSSSTLDSISTASVVVARQGMPFKRSVSDPRHTTSALDGETETGTTLNFSISRPKSAHVSPNDRRRSIVICPDYMASRRMSAGMIGGNLGKH